MGFVFTHCTPWPDLVRALFNDQGFHESALIFCGGLTPADFQIAFKRLEEQSRELEAAQVDTMGDLGGKKPHPATDPASWAPKCSPAPPRPAGPRSGSCSCRWPGWPNTNTACCAGMECGRTGASPNQACPRFGGNWKPCAGGGLVKAIQFREFRLVATDLKTRWKRWGTPPARVMES